MSNDLIKIINAETGEEIERELTDDEQAQRDREIADYEAKEIAKAAEAKAAEAAKEAAQAKLAALGLTTDDLKALGL
jgi:hypothetical protein